MRRFVFLLIICAFVQNSFGGAWVQKKGGYFFKLSGTYFFAENEFNHEGEKLKILEERLVFDDVYFRDINFHMYMEYGLTDDFTLIGKLPFKSYTSKRTVSTVYQTSDELATTSGFADLEISGKYAIFRSPVVFAVESGVKIPLGYSETPDNDGPRLGTGAVDIDGYLWVGGSLHPLPVYLTGSIGYRHRTGKLNDEIILQTEAGYTLGNFLIKSYFKYVKNTSTPPDLYGQPITTPLPGGGGVLPEIIVGDQDIATIFPSIIYTLNEQIALQAEVSTVLAGKNTLSGTAYSIGLIYYR
jgi:hypothetical protein